MKKEGQLTSIALIKDEALQIELILEERQKKSAIGTNGTNGNGTKPMLVNQIEDDEQSEINAIKKNGYKGQNYNPNYQNNKNNNYNGNKCSFGQKPGHQVEKCFTKFPALRPQNN